MYDLFTASYSTSELLKFQCTEENLQVQEISFVRKMGDVLVG